MKLAVYIEGVLFDKVAEIAAEVVTLAVPGAAEAVKPAVPGVSIVVKLMLATSEVAAVDLAETVVFGFEHAGLRLAVIEFGHLSPELAAAEEFPVVSEVGNSQNSSGYQQTESLQLHAEKMPDALEHHLAENKMSEFEGLVRGLWTVLG